METNSNDQKNVFQWKQSSMNEKRITYGNLFHNALNFYAFLATMRSKRKYRQNPGQMYKMWTNLFVYRSKYTKVARELASCI